MKKIRKIKRNIKFWWQRRTRGWDDSDCWNLNYQFVKWFHQHLLVYKEQASKMVDLEYHKFNYNGYEYTQLQLINKLIVLTAEYMEDEAEDNWNDLNSIKNEILDIFKLIFWTLWW